MTLTWREPYMPSRRARIWGALLLLAVVHFPASIRMSSGKEFLTDQEIEKLQDAQEIDLRVKIYLEAAALRLQTAEERLTGKDSEAGDPMEFYAPEDLLDAYYRILRSVMINLDDAFQKPAGDRNKIVKALKNLKESSDKSLKRLAVLKKIAEEKQKQDLWNRVNEAIEVTSGARDGAELGLSREQPSDKNNQEK
jgi:hypothetical protein